ncbi:hypothetical protein C0J52_03068, partial [Blattella germanica]
FSYDLCEAFLAADIPLWKINNPILRSFLDKYTKQHIFNQSTVCKTYITHCYNNVMSKLQGQLANEFLWASVDETTDVEGLEM